MSRPIGAVFHVPHGLSNAVLLPTVTRFSLAGAQDRYATVAKTMRLCSSDTANEAACEALVAGLDQLNHKLNVPRLGGCRGVERSRFEAVKEKMALDALVSGSPDNNPVVPTAEQIVTLYEDAF
jgi:alcohol dehydrogenase class IV